MYTKVMIDTEFDQSNEKLQLEKHCNRKLKKKKRAEVTLSYLAIEMCEINKAALPY